MNCPCSFTELTNGASLPVQGIPASGDFITEIGMALKGGARIVSMFGVPSEERAVLYAALASDADNLLFVGRSLPLRDSFPSLTPSCPEAHLFEREIWEQCGLEPQGHPWLKPLRKSAGNAPENGAFFTPEGREIHEVAVGPVHAGVIEPGHFRFQCAGEEVLHLEIALGYQHRGIEAALAGGPHRSTPAQMEAAAGDATIAHATSYAGVMEAFAETEAPLRAQWLRSIALELERIANHTGDLGALANDVAFLPTSSACGKLRGDFLNMTALLCGNRFGRNLVVPGGCRRGILSATMEELARRLKSALEDVNQAADWLWDCSSVRARFERVGVVSPEQAHEIGMVGPVARASGLVRDARYDHPSGWYRFAQAPVAVWPGGDVFARARVRWLEIQRSGAFILEQLASPPEGEMVQPAPALPPESFAVTLTESWRGEVCHAAITDSNGRFAKYKIVDPSFHNWTGLALAMRGQAIYDFPICNKSFNLSYCGFDL